MIICHQNLEFARNFVKTSGKLVKNSSKYRYICQVYIDKILNIVNFMQRNQRHYSAMPRGKTSSHVPIDKIWTILEGRPLFICQYLI